MNSVDVRDYGLKVGDKFYQNYPLVRKGVDLPETMRVTDISDDGFYFRAKYENRAVHNLERTFSSIMLYDSNLNPDCKEPGWIFNSQKLQTS